MNKFFIEIFAPTSLLPFAKENITMRFQKDVGKAVLGPPISIL